MLMLVAFSVIYSRGDFIASTLIEHDDHEIARECIEHWSTVAIPKLYKGLGTVSVNIINFQRVRKWVEKPV